VVDDEQVYMVLPVGAPYVPAHTTWQGAAEELAHYKQQDQDKYEVATVEVINDDG
jgi:hypothetical protein